MNQISKLGTRHEARGTRNEHEHENEARERARGTSTGNEHGERARGTRNEERGTPFREGRTLCGLQEPEFSESTLQFLSLPPLFFHPNSCSCSMKWCSFSSSNTQGEKTGGFFEHEARARARGTSTRHGNEERVTSTSTGTRYGNEHGNEERGTRHGEHLFVREGPFAGCRSQSSPKAPCNSSRSRPCSFTPNRARARAQ
jgi:hypothetical protein